MRWAWLALLVASSAAAQTASTIGITRGNFLRKPEYATQSALNLYVETTGNDANFCTDVTTPCLTIQGAVDKIPKLVRHPVTITTGLGTFSAGAVISGFTFDKAATGTDRYIWVRGALIDASPTTGPTTGTATSGTAGTADTLTWGTLTLTAAGWTVNDLRGKLIEITGGTGSGQIRPVSSNTADTITVPGTWTAPSATSTFAIRGWGTLISGVVSAPGTPSNPASAASAFYITDMAKAVTGSVVVDKFKFTHTTGRTLVVNSEISTVFQYCDFHSTSAANLINAFGAPSVALQYNYGLVPAGARLVQTQSTSMGSLYLDRNVVDALTTGVVAEVSSANATFYFNDFKNTSSALIRLMGSTSNISIATNKLDCNSAGGIGVDSLTASSSAYPLKPATRGNGNIRFTTNDISNCATAINLKGDIHAYFEAGVVSGTGNTTAVSVADQASADIEADTTLTGATELLIEGTAYTLANLRALSPKRIADLSTGAMVFEP